VTLAVLTAILSALIVYEALRFADARDRIRHNQPPPESPAG
jgi:hypothetical protein